MRYRALATLLREAGFTARQGKGDHEVWSFGPHQVVITQTRDISPGLAPEASTTIEQSQQGREQ